MARAKRGGEYGLNGEHYDGGQFLPGSPNTIKGEMTRQKAQASDKARKQEIAPYKWEVSDKRSIWQACAVGMAAVFTRTGYSKETGAQGFLVLNNDFNWLAAGWSEAGISEVKELINRWNNGERWI